MAPIKRKTAPRKKAVAPRLKKRTARLHVRLTPEEFEALTQMAKEFDTTTTDFVKKALKMQPTNRVKSA